MNPPSLNIVALALLLIGVSGMVVPTAALPTEDRPWQDEPAVSLRPAPGPNGDFASLDSEGNLTVDISDINTNAVTTVRDVFTVTNNEGTRYAVWVSHNASGAVEFFVEGHGSIEDSTDPLLLNPGVASNVSLRIDTYGYGTNQLLMEELTLHAQPAPQSSGGSSTPTATVTPTENATNATPTPTPTASPTPVPTDTPTPEPAVEEVVEIEFGVSTGEPDAEQPSYTVRELDLSTLDAEDRSTSPEAVITHATDGPVEIGAEALRLEAGRVDTLANVGEPVHLSGTRSLVGSADSVDPERRLAKLVEVEVPADRRDQPSVIRLTVARSRFGTSNPSSAVIGRKTADGWQLLDTQVVSVTDKTVTVEARTPGFSTFAVFTRNEVRYRWTLPDGTTVDGKHIRSEFDEPGRYEVTLTVTDAFGRSDTGEYHIVVNDQPSVVIEGIEDIDDDSRTTLRANVTDEVGNVTVTWTFADGSTTTGETVSRQLAEGEVVRVTVEDEFGASVQVKGTAGQPFRPPQDGSFDLVDFSLGLQSQLAFTGLAVILVIIALRWLADRRYGYG